MYGIYLLIYKTGCNEKEKRFNLFISEIIKHFYHEYILIALYQVIWIILSNRVY